MEMCTLDLTQRRYETGHSESDTKCLVAEIHQ